MFEIVEQAYRAFRYRKPTSTGVCERCCMDPRIEANFFGPAIRDLPLTYVRDWYVAACSSDGVPKETWAYLLPRVLEILASGEDASGIGVEVTLRRFDTGNPANWSSEQWRILDQFQRAYLRNGVLPSVNFLDDIVCMFRLGEWELQNLIAQVAALPDEELARKVWNDWCGWAGPGCAEIGITPFWEGPDKATVFDFYTSREVYERMERLALADDGDPRLAEQASAVATVIQANADWSG